MVVFGICSAYPAKLEAHALAGLRASARDSAIDVVSSKGDVFTAYAEIMRRHPDAEALVLMHDDLEFRDPELEAKVRLAVKHADVSGLIGARNAPGTRWWEGERAGRVTDLAYGLHDFGFAEPDVHSLDGMCLILSPWAVANLRLQGLGYDGLHGYADELCAQTLAAGRRVRVVDITATHHSRGGYTGGRETFDRAEQHFAVRRDPWAMLRRPPAEWDLAAMYDAYRGGPVSETPSVMMVVPSYREAFDIARRTEPSRAAIVADLNAHGMDCMRLDVEGDSLVQRMRQRAVGAFLKSTATHLLWCDLDIEARDPTCVRQMLASGFDVVAGACPFKTPDGRVVCNLKPGTVEGLGDTLALPGGCLEVQDVGTGFCLVSRRAIYALMQAHPELLHWSRGKTDMGDPLWALYDTGVVDGTYQSEDFMFCRLWQQLGGAVYVYVPATFRHYGTHGFEGSLMEQLGLDTAPAPAASAVSFIAPREDPRFVEMRDRVRAAGTDSLAHFGNGYTHEGGLYLQQNPDEFARLAMLLQDRGPSTYLEIGSASGGAARFLDGVVGFDRVASIDDGRHPRAMHQTALLPENAVRFLGDSHSDEAGVFVRSLPPPDVAFIDGDHSYPGVKDDVEMVLARSKPGSLIVLHDIVACDGVKQAWTELLSTGMVRKVAEYVGAEKPLGIGVAEVCG